MREIPSAVASEATRRSYYEQRGITVPPGGCGGAASEATVRADETPPEEDVRFWSLAELRGIGDAAIDFIVDGYVARRGRTLMASAPKMGKDTLCYSLIAAMVTGQEHWLGRAINPGPVILISEEDRASVLDKTRLFRIPDNADLRVITRDVAWPPPAWPELIAAVAEEVERVNASLVIISTLSRWARFREGAEKDSGATLEAIIILDQIAAGVIVQHHTRKGATGMDVIDEIRGSSGLAAEFDAVLALTRAPDDPSGSTRRLLTGISRWGNTTPAALLAELTGGGYNVVDTGDRGRVVEQAFADRLVNAIADQPASTQDDLADAMEVTKQRISKALSGLVNTGRIRREGRGRAGDPYRYTHSSTPVVNTPTEPIDSVDEMLSSPSSRREGDNYSSNHDNDVVNPSDDPQADTPLLEGITDDDLAHWEGIAAEETDA